MSASNAFSTGSPCGWQFINRSLKWYRSMVSCPHIINASADRSEEANPHLGCTIREVIVTGAERGHPNDHVRADGIIPIHRETTIDSLLAAFCVQCVVQLDSHILQATTLIKIGNSLTDASQDLCSASKREYGECFRVIVHTLPSRADVGRP
jgi:hypothetical protein